MFPSHIKECGLVPLTQAGALGSNFGHWYYPPTDEVFYQPDYTPPHCEGCDVCTKPEAEIVTIPDIPDKAVVDAEVKPRAQTPQAADSGVVPPTGDVPTHYLSDGTLVMECAGSNGPLYFAVVDGKKKGKAIDVTNDEPLPINAS